jgi:glycerol-3-phosphate responsive antiterminator
MVISILESLNKISWKEKYLLFKEIIDMKEIFKKVRNLGKGLFITIK